MLVNTIYKSTTYHWDGAKMWSMKGGGGGARLCNLKVDQLSRCSKNSRSRTTKLNDYNT